MHAFGEPIAHLSEDRAYWSSTICATSSPVGETPEEFGVGPKPTA